jgi:gluconolactonase
MALSADERTLYVLESNPAALVEIPILPDGTAGERRVIAELPGTVPDGVAVTTDGRFVIACYRPDAILLISAEGEVQTLAEDPQGTVLAAPTNVTFIGPGLDTMVVPNLGRWHMSTFALPGLAGIPLAYPLRQAIGS